MDISAIINFHVERLKSVPSIRSFLRCCEYAEERGFTVEKIAVLDSPDEISRASLKMYEEYFNIVLEVDHQDLGESRNSGRASSSGHFLAFFDGDDLWGEQWLAYAVSFCRAVASDRAICHPEVIYYFDTKDYHNYVTARVPSASARSFFFRHKDSVMADFKYWKIRYNNLWTSNSLGPREIYSEYPYIKANHDAGFGIEDWAWNAETLYDGVRHAVVPETVHMVRVKSTESLGLQNTARKLLPPLYRLGSI
jgi:glycosyltransferase involved in cell wall biosynthesis